MDKLKRFLVLVRVYDTTRDNLAKVVPPLQAQLAQLGQGSPEQVFRSLGGDTFGYFISSKLASGQILAALESPGKGGYAGTEPFLGGKDALFVMEIGSDFQASQGFTRAGTWLQRN
ncbi:hypothetical protein [Bosea lathyri]|uniref:Uncharacterized protein n=1 Tax=Bosea lathyri TaxID=1036778 RepID=A0A1H6BKF0_9HYPH|nr:hypothetical protein [Bosea lathyri]SEG61170.1 hypothetical protein SAMN04488115_107314 [Bosea lathyri]